MGRMGKAGAVFVAVVVMGVLAASTAYAAPSNADYRFSGNRKSSIGTPRAMVDIGPGTNSFRSSGNRTFLRFPKGNGVELRNAGRAIKPGTYTIFMQFKLDEVNGWRRLIDFKNGEGEGTGGRGDYGLYVKEGGLQFYPHTSPDDLIEAKKWVKVVLVRNGATNRMVAYLNGKKVPKMAFVDSGKDGVLSATRSLRFFRDNHAGGGPTSEHSAGAVDRIRLYPKALTAEQVAKL
jgi:hypothetical protein